MGLGGLQHYTIEPSDLERTKDFYCDVLGLENGDRPPLDFPGYWLYSGGVATVHLMGTRKPREGIVVRGTEKKYEDTGRLRPHRLCGDRCRGHAQAPAVERRQIPREHRAAHRRYAVLPLRSRWRRRRAEFPESLRPGCRRSSGLNLRPSRPGWFRCCGAKAHVMLAGNTARQTMRFPTRPQVSHQ